MATSPRPRRAAAPAPAGDTNRRDGAAKKTAANKKPAAKQPAATPEAVKAKPAPAPQPAAKKTASRKTAAKAADPKKRAAAPAPVPVAPVAPLAPVTEAPAAPKVAAKKAADKKPAAKKAPDKAPATARTAVQPPVEPPQAAKRPVPSKAPAKKGGATKAGAASPASAPASASASAPTPSPTPAQAQAPKSKKSPPRRRGADKGKDTGTGTGTGTDTDTDVSTVAASTDEAVPPEAAAVAEAPVSAAFADPAPVPAPAPAPQPQPPEPPAAHAHSAVVLVDGHHRQLRWVAGRDCPDALRAAAASCTGRSGQLKLDDDDALPSLLREAAAAGHELQVAPAAWQQLARRRDARQRLFTLEHAYPDGAASPSLQGLLRAPLAPFQAEGALFAACAGRALLADERGLGKTVQALATAALLHRHAGVERVLIHCSAEQRLSWQREAARFFGAAAPEWRVVSDEPGGPHADTIEAWKPGLVVIDEPARLARWDRIDAPFALALCGTPLEADAELAQALVAFLDRHREGPLARLHGRRAGDSLDHALQALMLRRRRADVQAQLPLRVASERVIPLGPLQRGTHDRAAAAARALLAGWRRTQHLPDAQQWDLGSALQAMRDACHRAEPAHADSALAENTLAALSSLTAELLAHADLHIAVVAPRAADAEALAERLASAGERCTVVAPGAPLPAQAGVVVAVGMPWQPAPADDHPRQWIHLLAEHSIDTALYDTRELRDGIASTPAEGGHHGFLHGAALRRYLLAAEAAVGLLNEPAGA